MPAQIYAPFEKFNFSNSKCFLTGEALQSEEEMRIVCAAFDRPVMVNIANGGVTPPLNAKLLAEIGFAFGIYPSLTSLVAASAMESALIQLRDDGEGEPSNPPVFDFKTFCSMIGFEDVWAFDRKWVQTN